MVVEEEHLHQLAKAAVEEEVGEPSRRLGKVAVEVEASCLCRNPQHSKEEVAAVALLQLARL